MVTLTAAEMLQEAEAAYHDLQLGKAIASARDSNGEEVRYTQADRTSLCGYINSLKAQVGGTDGGAVVSGPMSFSF